MITGVWSCKAGAPIPRRGHPPAIHQGPTQLGVPGPLLPVLTLREEFSLGATPPGPSSPGSPKSKSFHGNVAINPSAAKMRLVQIAEEIIAILAADPNAEVKINVEIQAAFPNGTLDQTKRAVSENAKTLGFNNAEWE